MISGRFGILLQKIYLLVRQSLLVVFYLLAGILDVLDGVALAQVILNGRIKDCRQHKTVFVQEGLRFVCLDGKVFLDVGLRDVTQLSATEVGDHMIVDIRFVGRPICCVGYKWLFVYLKPCFGPFRKQGGFTHRIAQI